MLGPQAAIERRAVIFVSDGQEVEISISGWEDWKEVLRSEFVRLEQRGPSVIGADVFEVNNLDGCPERQIAFNWSE